MKRFNKISSFIKEWKAQIIVGLLSLTIFSFLSINDYSNRDIEYLQRDSYSGEDQSYNLEVVGIDEENIDMEIEISKREYTKEEIDEIFDKAMAEAEKIILGNNNSFGEIVEKLNFINYVDTYEISIDISPDDIELIDFEGEVLNEDLTSERETYINIELKSGKYIKEFIIPVTVMPKLYTPLEKEARELKNYIEDIDKKNSADTVVPLPAKWKDRNIIYRNNVGSSKIYILVLGCIAGILLYLSKIQTKKDKLKKRNEELLLDYPDIVSKLVIYLGAGLSIRNTLEELINDYKKRGKKREAYEELAKAYVKISMGSDEGRAYRDFGRNIKLRQYLKLSSILEQNRRSGMGSLKEILEQETLTAWEERINFAKRQGEEASTKLLLPLLLMLLMIMILISVPALMALN